MRAALEAIAKAIGGTEFDGQVWLVGGAVRDELLGRPESSDLDLVTERDALALAEMLADRLGAAPPTVYPRFGTAMIRHGDARIELATARKESYASESRKPAVAAATLLDDARRRDFTVNALLRNVQSSELFDPLGNGLADLENRVLRTPLDPRATFHDDPLRMLRAVRFRWQLEFSYAEGLAESIRSESGRLAIISMERIKEEFAKMLVLPKAERAMADLMDLGLFAVFAPEFEAMRGVEQGRFHHLDVWEHTLLVLKNADTDDPILALACLLHDVGKPRTRSVDSEGNTRFFSHEAVGAEMAAEILRRLTYSNEDAAAVRALVKNHMRLSSAPELSPAAIRRLIRDLGDQLDRLLDLVKADVSALRPGVRPMDVASIRQQIAEARAATPAETLQSPLSGEEIMAILGLSEGPSIGRAKAFLTEKVLEGQIAPGDREAARLALREFRP